MLSGCRHHDAISFATNTQFGVKAGVDARQFPELQVGYNRQEGAIVPLYLDNATKSPGSDFALTQGMLEAAQKHVETAEVKQGAAAKWEDSARHEMEGAVAILADLKTRQRRDEAAPPSWLDQIHDKAVALNPAHAGDFAVLRAMITTEINKASLLARFDRDAKYIGRQNKDSSREDAYSVIAILNAGGKSDQSAGGEGSPNLKTDGKVAQYFATGIAAQELAHQGAAVVGGSAEASRRDYLNAEEILHAVAERITRSGDADRETTIRGCFQGVEYGVGETLDDIVAKFKNLTDMKAVRDRLEPYNTNANINAFHANLETQK